jgi:hypothetical protein
MRIRKATIPLSKSRQSRESSSRKRLIIFLLIAAKLLTLLMANPHEKSQYLRSVSKQVHKVWCEQPEGELCEIATPITRQALPIFLSAFTETYNYQVLTFFHTQLPCLDIFGVGIAGQILVFQKLDEDAEICNF